MNEAEPLPAVAPTSALAALASAFPPARQQSTTTAQAMPQPAESLATPKETDRVRAILSASQLACNPLALVRGTLQVLRQLCTRLRPQVARKRAWSS